MSRTLFTRRARGVIAAAAGAAMLFAAGCSNPGGGGGQTTEEGAEVPSDIQIKIPFSEGGGTDTWTRFLAPYLEEHVPNNPSIQPENVPGGESITGTNQFVQDGVTDGSELLATSGTTYMQALLGRDQVQYDFSKMRLLLLNGTGGVIYASASSGITLENLQNPPTELQYGGISATGADVVILQVFDLLGIDMNATFGFEGRGPARLALERGEINIDYQTTSAYQTQVQPMVDAGTAVPLMSFGYIDDNGEPAPDPNLPGIPTVEEVYEQMNGEAPSGDAYDAYRNFLLAGFIYQKGLWANEGTPDSIVEQFWSAAEELASDEEFQSKSEDVLGGYPLIPGDTGEETLTEAFEISDAQQEYVLNMLETKYGVTVE